MNRKTILLLPVYNRNSDYYINTAVNKTNNAISTKRELDKTNFHPYVNVIIVCMLTFQDTSIIELVLDQKQDVGKKNLKLNLC